MKEKMINLLLEEAIGRIVAINILSVIETGVLDRALVQEFLENCVQAYNEDEVHHTEALIGQFQAVARGERPLSTGNRKVFFLASKKCARGIKKGADFSTVVSSAVIKEHLLKDSATARGHSFFESNPNPSDPILQIAINRLNGNRDIYKPGACLGGNPARPLFWIAPADILSTERKEKGDDLGDAVRDRLGLIHYEDNTCLVEIRIPGKRLGNRKFSRPTFADAGDHRRFRFRPDGSFGKKRPGWGWAVDLEHFANAKQNIDGSPEQVVEQTDFNDRLNAKFEFAGVTRTVRGETPNDNDEAFSKRVCCGMSRTDLKKALLEIIP